MRARVVYGAVTAWFVAVFAALIWPIYPHFAGIRPMLLGLPLSLAYIVILLVASFLVLLALYLWEARTGRLEPTAGDPEGSGPAGS